MDVREHAHFFAKSIVLLHTVVKYDVVIHMTKTSGLQICLLSMSNPLINLNQPRFITIHTLP